MDQIFNELSAMGNYPDKYAAIDGIKRFLNLSIELAGIGFNPVIRTTQDFHQAELSAGFRIDDLRKNYDILNDRELLRYFFTNTTKSPYIEDLFSDQESEDAIEFKFKGKKSLSLGLAYLWDSPVISFDCDDDFMMDELTVSFLRISESDPEDKDITVLSLWCIKQLERMKSDLRKMLSSSIKNGQSFLNQSSSLFPYLSICGSARKQIQKLTGNEQFFPEMIRHFNVLNDTMRTWKSGDFNPDQIDWSNESKSTLDKYSDCRKFICLDKKSRQFSYHSKVRSANKRIYYYPIPAEKKVHIGHVGDHLPTVKYRT